MHRVYKPSNTSLKIWSCDLFWMKFVLLNLISKGLMIIIACKLANLFAMDIFAFMILSLGTCFFGGVVIWSHQCNVIDFDYLINLIIDS